MSELRLCACGCGRPIPAHARPNQRYYERRCIGRAYYRRKVASEPKAAKPAVVGKPAKPEPSFLPKRKPSKAAIRELEDRQRRRRERIGESLEQRVAAVMSEFREGRA